MSVEDPAARFCPHCGSPLVGSLTAWERFRRRPAWLQALALLPILALVGLGLALVAPKAVELLPGRAAAPTQPVAVVQTVAQETATLPVVAPSLEPTMTQPPVETVSPTLTPESPTSTPDLPAPTPTEDLDAALLDAAYRFQDAKAASQRTGETDQLSQDLTGDALERQVELVERWRNQGCYWEISLNAPLTVTILEMRGPDAALIEVAKVETRLLYCDDELESETRNDAYTTTYLMQRIAGRWYTAERE
jgi:hypothetical protein